MATTRIKDLTNTATSVASDEYLAIDGTTNGTSKITRDNFRTDTAAAFVAAPGTYNLAPLSGGAVPIDKGGTAATTAAGARTSLDVPSTSEAVLVANNLSDVTAATARANLSVNSIDEDAEATGTKLVGPALYFDGVNDVLEVADDPKLSFTDGTDDLPFTISAWVNMSEAGNFAIVNKYGTSNATREFLFATNASDKLEFTVRDTSAAYEGQASDAAITSYEGQWVHVSASYAGAGPSASSGNAFTAAADGITLYVGGQAVASTEVTSGTYTGMSDTSQALWIGRYNNSYAKGHIKDVKIFNRELTATEVAQLARGTDLGFSSEWGGALGGVYTSDFTSDSTDSWTPTRATLDAASTVGGDADNLKLVCDATASNTHLMVYTSGVGVEIGKRYRVEFDYYMPSGQTAVDSFAFYVGSSATKHSITSPTTDAWTRYRVEDVHIGTNKQLQFYLNDGGTNTFNGVSGEYVAFRNIVYTEIGTLADFRAENFDSATGKIYDLSSNGFVGTSANLPTLTGRAYPVYETGTWTPSVTFGGGSTGITYTSQSGNYTRIGDVVYINGFVTLSAKGSSSGNAQIGGFPFTTKTYGASIDYFGVSYASALATLTSSVNGLVLNNDTKAALYHWGATGASALTEANFTDTSTLRFSAVYKIQ